MLRSNTKKQLGVKKTQQSKQKSLKQQKRSLTTTTTTPKRKNVAPRRKQQIVRFSTSTTNAAAASTTSTTSTDASSTTTIDTPQSSESDSELDDSQMKIAMALSGDMRKRVIAQKMKKPTLAERIANTSDLYQDKTTLQITPDDIGTLIPMDLSLQPKSATYYLRPECEDGDNGYWLIRQSTLDALNFIDSHTNAIRLHRPRKPDTIYNIAVPNLAIVYGHHGTSKSFTISQAADYAKRKGDIVVSVGGYDTIHDLDGVIMPSAIPNHEGMYDQILKSRRFLETMAIQYADQLKQIKLTLPTEYYTTYGSWLRSEEDRYNAPEDNQPRPESYPFPKPDVIARPSTIEPGKTLFDLAALGAWRSDLAGRASTDFLYELKKQTDFPVFIAIDDVNALVQKSDYMNPANLRTRLDATRLTFVRSLIDCIENPPQRGSTMIATSSKFTSFRIDSFIHRSGVKIRTTSYTLLEHQAMLEHYFTSKIILSPMDIEFFRRSQVVTGSQPKSLRQFASVQ